MRPSSARSRARRRRREPPRPAAQGRSAGGRGGGAEPLALGHPRGAAIRPAAPGEAQAPAEHLTVAREDVAGSGGRHAALIAAGIFLSRVFGYVRQRVMAHYIGNSGAAADAIGAALKIPNIIRNLLGEGTLLASFIPVYAALNEREDKGPARALAGTILGLLLLASGILAVLGVVFAPAITTAVAAGFDESRRHLTIALVRILFPMTGLMVVSAWCLGVLNTHRRFFLPYAAPVIWNVAGIAALVVAGTGLVSPPLPVEQQLSPPAPPPPLGLVAGRVLPGLLPPPCPRGGAPGY